MDRRSQSVAIETARTKADWDAAHRLFEEYAAGLGFDLAFQDFDRELANLPVEYGEPTGCVLLARLQGEPVGCVGVRPLDGRVCEMKRLYVRRELRQAGVGRALVLRILDEAARRGYTAMRLDTMPSMTAARKLYASLGFHEIEPYRYNPTPCTVFMERRLDIGTPRTAESGSVGAGEDSS